MDAAKVIALTLMLVSLFGVVPPQTFEFWKLGLLSVEWGGWFLVAALVLLSCLWWQSRGSSPGRLRRLTAVVTAGAASVFGLAVVDAQMQAAGRSVALSPGRLFFGGLRDTPANVTRDLPYVFRDGKPLTLDVYQPQSREALPGRLRPAVVVVHGGGWNHGQKSDFARFDRWLTGLNMVVFDTSYRLAGPEARFPAQVDDLSATLAWVADHAAEYGVDPDRMCLLGRSAGGQLALVAAYNSVRLSGGRSNAPPVRAVISLYGPTDLVWGYNNICRPDLIDARFLLENFLAGTPANVPEQYALASPVSQVTRSGPPTLLLHGGADHLVSYRHVRFLRDKLATVGVPCESVIIDRADHGFDANFDGLHSQIAQAEIAGFLTKYLINTK